MLRRSIIDAVVLGVASAALSGCGDAPQTATTVAEPSAHAAGSSWQTQIAAVRDGQSDAIRVTEEEVSGSQLQQLNSGCEHLTTLIIEAGSAGVGDVAVIAHLAHLRQLRLPGQVNDTGIEAITACRELELLNLPRSVITDHACKQIARLDQLMLLRFGSPHVTDEGIRAIAKLPRLRFLHLLDVPISDAALDDVASMTTLESFYLDGGRVSDEGLRRLIMKRPDLHVHLDQTHVPGDPNANH